MLEADGAGSMGPVMTIAVSAVVIFLVGQLTALGFRLRQSRPA